MYPQAMVDTDIGVAVGQTWERQGYGFRFFPYRNRFRTTYAINPVRLGARVGTTWEFPIGRRGVGGLVDLEGVTRDVRWYYGLGNDTQASAGRTFYSADRAVYSAAGGLTYRPVGGVAFALTPMFWHSRAVDRDSPTLISTTRPPTLDAVNQVGLAFRAEVDRRDSPVVARSGFHLELETKLVPELLDADQEYVVAQGAASLNLPLGSPVLSFRAGGAHLFGDAPYFEWPQLGGRESLRGYTEDRFTGRSAVFGSAHLRAPLFDFVAFFPGTLGATALVDAGRVFVDAESSDRVHVGYGGGLWVSLVRADLLANLNVVRSREGIGVYLAFDFPY
jgi:hypothetical protein